MRFSVRTKIRQAVLVAFGVYDKVTIEAPRDNFESDSDLVDMLKHKVQRPSASAATSDVNASLEPIVVRNGRHFDCITLLMLIHVYPPKRRLWQLLRLTFALLAMDR